MKAALVAIFFLAAVAYSMGRLTEQQCRTPVPSSMCAEDAKTRTIYSFNNNTNKCERVQDSCGEGINQFERKGCCISECPYGRHSKPSNNSNGNF
uniref:Putative secreted protein n=1 Tax=Ixodes scapularis TaxID=6945 RepID=Q8MVE7_IXOSC|nr:putative secreted protein [Ixodes scapularis]